MKDEVYGAELDVEKRMQLSFLIDWAERYIVDAQRMDWERFREAVDQCNSAQELKEIIGRDYIGVNQAPEDQVQREQILQRVRQIIEDAGFSLKMMPCISIGHRGVDVDGASIGWYVLASDVPGDRKYTPQMCMELDGEGYIQHMEYMIEGSHHMAYASKEETAQSKIIGERVSRFLTSYVCPGADVQTTLVEWGDEGEEKTPYWIVDCRIPHGDVWYEVVIREKTMRVYSIVSH